MYSNQIETIKRELKGKYGVYLLFISLSNNITSKIGSLEELSFNRGIYVYIGSALGPGGLEKRIIRHLHLFKKKFWHIDYFLDSKFTTVTTIGVYFTRDNDECLISNLLRGFLINYSLKEISKFGSSDCKCKSHLFYINEMINIERLIEYFNEKGFKVNLL